MDKELFKKFFDELKIVTQEDDTGFPYANPSDAARSLIRSRNWVGTITESVVELSERISEATKLLNKIDSQIARIEKSVFSKVIMSLNIPTWVTKNKEAQKAFIYANATAEDLDQLKYLEEEKGRLLDKTETLKAQKEDHLLLLKMLDRSTEWVVQYINWSKYEARG